eukprot:GEZU01003140.1.p1 GENE.GEZU01003140.1~~GEZU01003140.1.p1  ORF type:complete len:166 (-),score=15.79 GEZU01003140.1:117-614(-)
MNEYANEIRTRFIAFLPSCYWRALINHCALLLFHWGSRLDAWLLRGRGIRDLRGRRINGGIGIGSTSILTTLLVVVLALVGRSSSSSILCLFLLLGLLGSHWVEVEAWVLHRDAVQVGLEVDLLHEAIDRRGCEPSRHYDIALSGISSVLLVVQHNNAASDFAYN